MKKALSLICSIFLIISVSCSNIYDTLANIGNGLGATGTNVFGLGKPEAKKASDATNEVLFGAASTTETPSTGILKGDAITAGINEIFTKEGDDYKTKVPEGLADPTDGKIDLNVATEAYLTPFILPDEDYDALLESIKEIKSDEARKEFANSMKDHFYADGEQPIPADVVGATATDFKNVLHSEVQPEITKFVEAIVDASIDVDASGNGYLTKAGVLMISSLATIVERVFQKGSELQGIPREDFDLNELSSSESLELIKYCIVDVKNLHTILLTAVGYDSDAATAINNILTMAVVGRV